ncbi:DUF4123 domain-containing protein [Ectopseudomonas mendocina]|uniref:DUF4123 domain-containing protein n=1 Tax=Ectopseudomonas mendocina TaxID=300 RepID=A0ABZ2RCH8_ECTME
MHEGLNEFLQALERADTQIVSGQSVKGERHTLFIIDQQAVPDIQVQIYKSGEDGAPTQLYRGSQFEHLADIGPLCFRAKAGSALQHLGEKLCQEHKGGIGLITTDYQAAVKHARDLLVVNDGSGGQSLITYYKRDMWAALALTANDGLYGSWQSVFSPAPMHIGNKTGCWLNWMPNSEEGPRSNRYNMPANTNAFHRNIRWVYWVDEHFELFNKPETAQLPALIDNLELLVDHGIYEGRWIVRLAGLASRFDLSRQPAVMTILRSDARPFNKVDELEALTL